MASDDRFTTMKARVQHRTAKTKTQITAGLHTARKQARALGDRLIPPPAVPPEPPPPPAPEGSPLYTHAPNPHAPRNPNLVKAQALAASGFNIRLAVWLTNHVGTMQTAYVFAGIGIGSLVGVFTGNVFLAALFGGLSSYFLQLVLLPVIMVGQNVLSSHQEAQADEAFTATMRTLHDEQQNIRHLNAQDRLMLQQLAELQKQTPLLLAILAALHIEAPPTPAEPSAGSTS
jgi:hypothetical protein